MTVTRKQFLGLGLSSAAAALLGACGDDEGGGGTTGNGTGATGNGSTGGSGNDGNASTGGTGNAATGGTGNTATGGTGNTGTGGTPTSSCVAGGMLIAAVSNNHGHALEVPYDDVIAGVEMTYSAQGTAGHCHEVTITAADFAELAGGGSITLHSCNGGDHEYVLSCAAAPPAPGPPDCNGTPTFGTCG